MNSDIRIRTELRPGDIGRLIYFSGLLGSADYGYPTAFEGYVAKTFAEFVTESKPRNRLWIAEDAQGNFVGSIGVVDRNDSAQLRWFSLIPERRGEGIGRKLFDGALAYCREAGFIKVWLSTFEDSELAIKIYERRGFRCIEEKPFMLEGRTMNELIFEKVL